jgi:integrase
MVMYKLKYIVALKSKGRVYYYFRRGPLRVPMPEPTDAAFQAKYARLIKSLSLPDQAQVTVLGSFGELVQKFIASPEFQSTTAQTKADRMRLLNALPAMWRDLPAKRLSRAAVLEYRDTHKENPGTGNYAVRVLRRLCSFAIDRGYMTTNPAARPGRLKVNNPHRAWSDVAVTKFREACTDPMARLGFEIGLATGQRLGDVLKMTRADYDGQTVACVQNKTGVKVRVPAHSELKPWLDSVGDRFLFLTTRTGKQFTRFSFGKIFRAQVLKAGLDGLNFHGLRKTATVRLAEAGCTDTEIQAVTGHKTASMVAHYRAEADKTKAAVVAMRKLESVKV